MHRNPVELQLLRLRNPNGQKVGAKNSFKQFACCFYMSKVHINLGRNLAIFLLSSQENFQVFNAVHILNYEYQWVQKTKLT